MTTKMSLTAFILCALPTALIAQSSTSSAASANGSAAANSTSSVNSTSSANSNARIDASFQHAAQLGIPASLLENKVAEGQAKGVSQAQIAAAIEHRLTLLQSAQGALTANGQTASAAEMNAGADALAAGATLASLQDVRSASSAQTGAGALTLLASFVQSGEASANATAHVEALLLQNPAVVTQASIAALANIGGTAASQGAASQSSGAASQASSAASIAGQASGLLHVGHN